MPSFIVHLLIPPLLLAALRLAPNRAILWMLPFTLLPDVDYFVGVHRAWTGNVFILLPALYLWHRWRETEPVRAGYAAVAAFYLGSHLFMDVFAGGTVLFWPIWDQNVFLFFEVIIDTETNQPITNVGAGTEAGAPQVARFFRWISAFETAMAAMTAVTLAGAWLWRRTRRETEVVVEELG